MSSFWSRLFRTSKSEPAALSLVDYAANYLTVFEIGSQAEKTRHAAELFNAAHSTAQHSGATDFMALIEGSDVTMLGKAAVYSRQRFEEMKTTATGGYWLSAYALTHLMILNYVGSLEDVPQAKAVAVNAAHLYSAEYARRKMSA